MRLWRCTPLGCGGDRAVERAEGTAGIEVERATLVGLVERARRNALP